MNRVRLVVGAALASIALAACGDAQAPDEVAAKLRTATLEATGAAATQAVTVSGQQRTGSRWVWTATIDGRAYACDADNLYRLPACEPATQPGA